MKEIFDKSVRRLYGGANLDRVMFNYEFRLRWFPFDVCHRKEDKDSFPFILFENNGYERIAAGGHNDSYDDIMTVNAVEAETVVLKGRGWSDAQCMVVDQKNVSMNTLLATHLSMRDDYGIDISTWNVYNPLIKSVVPEVIYRKTAKRVMRQVHRIIALHEKVLADVNVFSDCIKEHPDSIDFEKLKRQIRESLKEYKLSHKCGLLSESEAEYQDVAKKLNEIECWIFK